jgi:hypothetical protein
VEVSGGLREGFFFRSRGRGRTRIKNKQHQGQKREHSESNAKVKQQAGKSARSTRAKAHSLRHAGLRQGGGGFVYCGAELSYGPGDFFFCDYGGWGQQEVIAGGAVDAALHGVDEEAAGHGGGGDASGEV